MRRAHKRILAAAIALEVAVFSLIAPNFLTTGNVFEIARLNVELGLLAIALTPILITGGIDLSVGAMMGLSAVSFGAAWHDLQLPLALAAVAAMAVGTSGRRLERVARLEAEPASLDRDARHVCAVSGHRRGDDGGSCQLHRFSGAVSALRARISLGRHPGAAADFPGGAAGVQAFSCTGPFTADRCTPSGSARVVRDIRASPSAGESGSCICFRASLPASRRSSTSRTSGRHDRMREMDTSSTRLRPSCSAAHRCSAGTAASAARFSGCWPCRC